ncbi:hypothetical protein J1605_010777 [Eschrichtius robustus]|uniref:Uncharacterized protein n=1 Tax=Eschrichtius robustus TaxID=9764 RepID=A0AB34GRA0_ESCRO|nr:hypothetical protein J1605_010777 [Eschrichtius robustus]
MHVNVAHPGSTFPQKTSKNLAVLLQNTLTSTLPGSANLSEEEERQEGAWMPALPRVRSFPVLRAPSPTGSF